MFLKTCFAVVLVLIVGSCTGSSLQDRLDEATRLGGSAGFKFTRIETSFFTLAVFYRSGMDGDFNIYIEGDGFAYVTRNRLSENPTPVTPTGLMLAISDLAKNVIYIARPCQYVDLSSETRCSQDYWSTHRFAEEVVASFDQALDRIKKSARVTGFNLVGYSGGGAVAALLAARRDDIKSLRTVAGYLDHVALNVEKGVAPLWGSLDPMLVAASLTGIPQVHYSGGRDGVIPPWVGEKFAGAVADHSCARSVTVAQAGHESGWKEFWKVEHVATPSCY